jgi:hypothetical protein
LRGLLRQYHVIANCRIDTTIHAEKNKKKREKKDSRPKQSREIMNESRYVIKTERDEIDGVSSEEEEDEEEYKRGMIVVSNKFPGAPGSWRLSRLCFLRSETLPCRSFFWYHCLPNIIYYSSCRRLPSCAPWKCVEESL